MRPRKKVDVTFQLSHLSAFLTFRLSAKNRVKPGYNAAAMPDQKPTLEYEDPATKRDDTLRSLHRIDRLAVRVVLVFLAILTALVITLVIWIFTHP